MTDHVLSTSANWEVYIPPSYVDPLPYDETQALIAALHDGGADETTNYSGIVATYFNCTESDAVAMCQATLATHCAGVVFKLESP